MSLYIYNWISQLWLTFILLDTGTAGTSREIYTEDADDGTRTRNPSVIELNNSKGIAGKELSWFYPVEPLYFSDEKLTTVEKWQIYNDANHQLDKLNSFPAIAFELFSLIARAPGL